ncbi:MAG: DUF4831 family protein [Prevotellaceae bacterium]|jgi:hypothetical protein|nr:DUF4831 family protein [Prevotellaceae bacterium]
MKKTSITILSLIVALPALAQQHLPNGVVVYALPKTTLKINAEATREVFTAGPYAKFAPKYLGFEVPVDDKVSYSLKSLEMEYYVEADAAKTYTVILKDSKSASNFLSMTSTGLVAMFENNAISSVPWRFGADARQQQFTNRGHEPTLAKETTTFYRTAKTDAGFERVPVQQSQVVEKNVERRAEEVANAIFSLRKRRIEMITGDAGDGFSGDAMRAALEELNRMEQEYLSLFVGKSSFDIQSADFEVIPDPTQAKQLYVAFRFSESQGLMMRDNVAGRPIVLELVESGSKKPSATNANDTDKGRRVSYRIPEVITARLSDVQNVLLEMRVPMYQFGVVMTFPIDVR